MVTLNISHFNYIKYKCQSKEKNKPQLYAVPKKSTLHISEGFEKIHPVNTDEKRAGVAALGRQLRITFDQRITKHKENISQR